MTTRILHDNETDLDLLNNEVIANTIVDLLREQPENPVTVGIHGDWGAGKSSILQLIEAAYKGHGDSLCLKFNGWRFQGFEDAKIALIEGIVNGLIDNRPLISKASSAVKEVLKRIDWLKLAKKAGGLAFTAVTGIPGPDVLSSIVGVIGKVKDKLSGAGVDEAVEATQALFKQPGEGKNVPEEVAAFHAAFEKLLAEAKIRQLVVLIDDLDRCLPDTAIDTLEAVRLFLFTKSTAFVVAADEAMIEYAVRKHFPDLPESSGPRTYARNYLEKLVQVPFRIPALGEMETRMYVSLLLIGAEVGASSPGYRALVAEAKARMRRPWQGKYLDPTVLKAQLGSDSGFPAEALLLSERIGPVLAATTSGNPRQIKRFINSLLLRMRTAKARGFAADVNIQVLAKLMLAERNFPDWFDRMAALAARSQQGTSEEIAGLEAYVTARKLVDAGETNSSGLAVKVSEKGGGVAKKKLRDDKETHSDENSTEVMALTPLQEWAGVEPAIREVDLRPYLFVVKDRKNFFGPISALGHLIPLVDKLCGPPLVVQGYSKELKALTTVEAEQVFELLRSRIVEAGQLKLQPKGIDGMQVLVKAHPLLEQKIVDFIGSLPPENLGPWAITGWSSVIKSPECKSAILVTMKKWSEVDNNSILALAAKAALKSFDKG